MKIIIILIIFFTKIIKNFDENEKLFTEINEPKKKLKF
jgi:hypothetical protein